MRDVSKRVAIQGTSVDPMDEPPAGVGQTESSPADVNHEEKMSNDNDHHVKDTRELNEGVAKRMLR